MLVPIGVGARIGAAARRRSGVAHLSIRAAAANGVFDHCVHIVRGRLVGRRGGKVVESRKGVKEGTVNAPLILDSLVGAVQKFRMKGECESQEGEWFKSGTAQASGT